MTSKEIAFLFNTWHRMCQTKEEYEQSSPASKDVAIPLWEIAYQLAILNEKTTDSEPTLVASGVSHIKIAPQIL